MLKIQLLNYLGSFQVAHLGVSFINVVIISVFGFENDVVGLFYQLPSASCSPLSTVHRQNNDKA